MESMTHILKTWTDPVNVMEYREIEQNDGTHVIEFLVQNDEWLSSDRQDIEGHSFAPHDHHCEPLVDKSLEILNRMNTEPRPDGSGTALGLPSDPKARKAIPIYSGCIKYFPDALAAVAELSRIGNDQHNPGKPLHWDRSKSGDELDALTRHLLDAGTLDTDGIRHSAKVAWRALANLQKEIEGSCQLEGTNLQRAIDDALDTSTPDGVS